MITRPKGTEDKIPTDDLETPPWLFGQLNSTFHFNCDAAATAENTLCPLWFPDSLIVNWKSAGATRVFLNPPYSDVEPFLKKATEEQARGVLTVALLKLDTSVEWWDKLDTAHKIPIRRRIRFWHKGERTRHAASFPGVLAFFYPWRSFEREEFLLRGGL